jgi:alpha-beta hydrolase superfamily lysophospholipase
MKKLLFLIGSCLLFFTNSNGQYRADLLGEDFECRAVEMPSDEEGKVICTIVRKKAEKPNGKAVLYIHGFCDYFFNKELAQACTEKNITFFAIDLRKYGRSFLPHQRINSCRNLREYFPDIDTALSIIKSEGYTDVTINAHSTGGLTTSLYAAAHPSNKKYKRIVLNSPFLSMNQSWFKEKILIPIMSFIGNFFPKLPLPKGLSGLYGESIHKGHRGEWEYNETWKPIVAFPMDAGWLRAIHKGHQQIKKGLNLNDSILVLSSGKSIYGEEWTDEFRKGDAVLDVIEIQELGKKLGPLATTRKVENGLHDLALSATPVRVNYFSILTNYINTGK